jgi:hypothetical protein
VEEDVGPASTLESAALDEVESPLPLLVCRLRVRLQELQVLVKKPRYAEHSSFSKSHFNASLAFLRMSRSANWRMRFFIGSAAQENLMMDECWR